MQSGDDSIINTGDGALATDLDDAAILRIAERVAVLMQLDRNTGTVSTKVDMEALANVPFYISSVFREANTVNTDASAKDLYEVLNKRISDLQAQIYLMRLELDNRFERDPARVYEDPLFISAYGERLSETLRMPRDFTFEPSFIAHGWHSAERNGDVWARWMRSCELSVVCLPHLGKVDQIVVIHGHLLNRDQLATLKISVGDVQAEITVKPRRPEAFVAELRLSALQVQSSNFLPIEFRMTDYRQATESNARTFGACVSRFECRPLEISALGSGE